MEAVLQQFGNNLAISIPHKILKKMNLNKGNKLEIKLIDNKIVIEPKKSNLSDMLSRIDKNNIHKEVDFGKAEGKEIW